MINSDFILHVVKGYLGHIILAEYKSSFLILDAGCRSDATRIKHYITKGLKKSMSGIKLVIVSHAHPDHAGGAVELKKKYNIPIACSSQINNWYSGIGGAVQHKIDILMGYWVAIKSRNMGWENIFYQPHFSIDMVLKQGTPLPFFRDWQAIEVPGHTSHDIAIYNRKHACLYTGDVLIKVKGKYLLPFPVCFPSAMKITMNRLKGLKVKQLLLAHGGVVQVKDFPLVIENLLKSLERGPGFFWNKLMYLQYFSPEVRKRRF